MATLLQLPTAPVMSNTKPRDVGLSFASSVVARRPVADPDKTLVDIRPPATGQRGLPAPKSSAQDRSNVIPFTKPRAIAALAAANPTSVAISDPLTRSPAIDAPPATKPSPRSTPRSIPAQHVESLAPGMGAHGAGSARNRNDFFTPGP